MITVKELSSAVGVSERAARNWLARRPHLGIRVGGRRLVPRGTVGEYKRSQAVNRAAPIDAVPELIRRIIRRHTRKVGSCEIWSGMIGHDGLPRASIPTLPIGRFAYVMKYGPLEEGQRVGVSCGNPRCVEHLKVLA